MKIKRIEDTSFINFQGSDSFHGNSYFEGAFAVEYTGHITTDNGTDITGTVNLLFLLYRYSSETGRLSYHPHTYYFNGDSKHGFSFAIEEVSDEITQEIMNQLQIL